MTRATEAKAGRLVTLAAGVRRLTAPNPGMMTGPGTNTYLVGARHIAVIDPGPAIDEHVDAILEAGAGKIRQILVTHTHPDHSPAASLLASRTGAELLGRAAPDGPHQDGSFRPDRSLRDGHSILAGDVDIECIHTPGHASNHFCFLQKDLRWLYTGDHVMSGSTVVIDPPDGDMHDYLESLRRLSGMRIDAIAPGHGDLITEPQVVIRWIIDHRTKRENKVVDALASNPDSTSEELVRQVYRDTPTALHALAERSLLAHLIKLEREARAEVRVGRWRLCDS